MLAPPHDSRPGTTAENPNPYQSTGSRLLVPKFEGFHNGLRVSFLAQKDNYLAIFLVRSWPRITRSLSWMMGHLFLRLSSWA